MASSSVHDPAILDVLSAIDPTSLDSKLYRAVFAGVDPTVGSLAGGRWAPPQAYEVLYASTNEACSIAEVYFHLRRQPIFPRRTVELHTLKVKTSNTIDISNPVTCKKLGLDGDAMLSLDYTRCRDVGHAAEFLGYDALIVRSARYDASNVVLILGNHNGGIESIGNRPIDWSKDI